MKATLSEFLMEDWLEKHRFSARFNAGESGHRSQNLASFLAGLQPDFSFSLGEALAEVMLCDAPNMGMDELRVAVASLHPGSSSENILITTGTSEAILLLLRQLKPKKVAVLTPAFQLLTEIPKSLGAQILPLSVHWDEHGIPNADLKHWCELLRSERPDVFILNHPHNPSGLVFDDFEMGCLIEAAESVGCTVVGDEHYRFLSGLNPDAGKTLYRPGRFVTGSFIKCTGTPGLRIGWCVGDSETLRAMQSEKNYLTHTVNPLSQILALWFLQSLERNNSFFAPLHREWLLNKETFEKWVKSQESWFGASPCGGLVSCLFSRHPSSERDIFLTLRKNEIFLLPLSSFHDSFLFPSQFSSGFRIGFGLRPGLFKEMLSVMVRNRLS